jgi:hypothetical protein
MAGRPMVEMTPALHRRNFVTAVALLGFVGGVYYTAISKMRQTDELSKVIEREELKEGAAKKK